MGCTAPVAFQASSRCRVPLAEECDQQQYVDGVAGVIHELCPVTEWPGGDAGEVGVAGVQELGKRLARLMGDWYRIKMLFHLHTMPSVPLV